MGEETKMELIRLAAIPYHDEVVGLKYTLLQCINRVFCVEVLDDTPHDNWLGIRVDQDVEGLGVWQCDTMVYISDKILKI